MPKPTNTQPPGAPPNWKSGAQVVVAPSHNISKAARGVAATTMEGNAVALELEQIAILPEKL